MWQMQAAHAEPHAHPHAGDATDAHADAHADSVRGSYKLYCVILMFLIDVCQFCSRLLLQLP